MARTLSARQRIYVRKHARALDLDPSEMAGELNVIPFLDIVVNLIMFLLATTEAVLLIAQIESDLPKISRGQGKKSSVETPLNLNVTVTENGVLVSGSGGKLAPGCLEIAPGGQVTVARKQLAYDWAGLTECVSRVKQQFEAEDTVTVSADPQVAYEHEDGECQHDETGRDRSQRQVGDVESRVRAPCRERESRAHHRCHRGYERAEHERALDPVHTEEWHRRETDAEHRRYQREGTRRRQPERRAQHSVRLYTDAEGARLGALRGTPPASAIASASCMVATRCSSSASLMVAGISSRSDSFCRGKTT